MGRTRCRDRPGSRAQCGGAGDGAAGDGRRTAGRHRDPPPARPRGNAGARQLQAGHGCRSLRRPPARGLPVAQGPGDESFGAAPQRRVRVPGGSARLAGPGAARDPRRVPRLPCGTVVPAAGAGGAPRLRDRPGDRRRHRRDLPSPRRAAAGDRDGRRLGEGAVAGRVVGPPGPTPAAADRRSPQPPGPTTDDARRHRLEPRPADPAGAGAVPSPGCLRRQLHPAGCGVSEFPSC